MYHAYLNRDTNVGPRSMLKQLVPDELWTIIDPLLPSKPPKPNGGRPRVPDRTTLAGIIYVLKSGIL
jgi:transposase